MSSAAEQRDRRESIRLAIMNLSRKEEEEGGPVGGNCGFKEGVELADFEQQ